MQVRLVWFDCDRVGSGLHRELNHKVKSLTLSSFTEADVAALTAGGNKVVDRAFAIKQLMLKCPCLFVCLVDCEKALARTSQQQV